MDPTRAEIKQHHTSDRPRGMLLTWKMPAELDDEPILGVGLTGQIVFPATTAIEAVLRGARASVRNGSQLRRGADRI